MKEALLELRNITKTFPSVKAVDNVSLAIMPGEVHALMGENGAGKSTLMKIIDGIYTPDEGQILINGKIANIKSPLEAMHNGIAMIHQELNIVLDMTIAENIYLGREPRKGLFYDKAKMIKESRAALQELGLDIDPTRKMRTLSVAKGQMVEIAKAMLLNAKVFIMDEPTSAISDKEVDRLFKLINKFTASDVGIVYISHKMDEIYQIADKISVLRDGQMVGTYKATEIDSQTLIAKMVGRSIEDIYPAKIPHDIGEEALRVENLTSGNIFKNISFSVRKGEILGISGLMGSGRSEVVESIFGMRDIDSGGIFVNGKKVQIDSPKDAINQKIAFVTEDRAQTGLNKKTSVKKDMSILTLNDYCVLRQFILDKKENTAVDKEISRLNIKTPTRNENIGNLSGGNQQKVIIARWLLNDPEIFIMDEPTRGIDVGAKFEIYSIIMKLVAEGKSVIMISSELPEILGICDRVIVMHGGTKTGELNREEMTQERIMLFASGMEGKYEY